MHLQEISVTLNRETYKYGLLNQVPGYYVIYTSIWHIMLFSFKSDDVLFNVMLLQAWTAVQIFNEGYVPTQLYQLPLFHGPPKPYLLRALAKDNTRQWIVANVVNGNVSCSMPRRAWCVHARAWHVVEHFLIAFILCCFPGASSLLP